jgi:hypothetical protein
MNAVDAAFLHASIEATLRKRVHEVIAEADKVSGADDRLESLVLLLVTKLVVAEMRIEALERST